MAAVLVLELLVPVAAARAEGAVSGRSFWPRVVLESQVGPNAPGGTMGLGLALRFWDRVDLTAGVASDISSIDRYGFSLSARGWWFRRGRLSLGTELGASRQNDYALGPQLHARPGFSEPDSIDYQWHDTWRANGALLLRVALTPAWHLQLAGGLGWMLAQPNRCDFLTGSSADSARVYTDSCQDPSIPQHLRVNPRPLRPYGQVTLAYLLPFGDGEVGGTSADGATPFMPQTDARGDRAVFAPTARVQKPGTLAVGLELLVLGASYVLPSRTEIAARFLSRLTDVQAGSVQVKQAVLHEGRVQVTALAGYGAASEGPGQSHTFWGAGLAAGYCFDDACESLASLSALAGKYQESYDLRTRTDDATVVLAPNLLFALARNVKLVLEVDGKLTGDPKLLAAAFAIRLHARSFAADLGALVTADRALPAVSLTWRPFS